MTKAADDMTAVTPHDVRARSFARLHPGARLFLDRPGCLPLQSPYLACRRCAEACPAGVLHVTAGSLSLDDGCLQCGRCAAACPTGALHVPGFAIADVTAVPVQVDCWKVPPEESPAGALRVPCLGGVAVSQWLSLAAAAEPHGVVALDRGWCGQCSAGAREAHPASAALDRARDLLAAVSMPSAARPRVEVRALPLRHRLRPIPDQDPAANLGRRRFLKSLGQQAVAAALSSAARQSSACS